MQASPSTSIPSVARKSRSDALAKITNDSGVSWFLISSTINLTILWLILHSFWPWSSSLAIQGCNSLSAWRAHKAVKVTMQSYRVNKKWKKQNYWKFKQVTLEKKPKSFHFLTKFTSWTNLDLKNNCCSCFCGRCWYNIAKCIHNLNTTK